MIWARRLVLVLLASLPLAACASTQSAGNTTSGGTGSGQCNEPCVLFHLQISFTGLDNVQGSFVDDSSGEGYGSCADWAKGDSVGWVPGPGTVTSHPVVIDGKSLSFGVSVGKDKFHGPGTYTEVLLGGVSIGADNFLGNTSTETLNADGSGQATFSNLPGGSVTGPQGTESGTVTWTCTK